MQFFLQDTHAATASFRFASAGARSFQTKYCSLHPIGGCPTHRTQSIAIGTASRGCMRRARSPRVKPQLEDVRVVIDLEIYRMEKLRGRENALWAQHLRKTKYTFFAVHATLLPEGKSSRKSFSRWCFSVRARGS